MTALQINWVRDWRHPTEPAHAIVIGLDHGAQPEQGLQPGALRGALSPVCFPRGSTTGTPAVVWSPAPYAKRCQGCVESLRDQLEGAITMPRTPVRLRLVVEVMAKPDEVDHAIDLMQSYVGRTKTFWRHPDQPPTVKADVIAEAQ